ncbi:MAG: HAMP domain-containing protein [Leptolyngbya sp. SIO1D8]|nr:HAMP domain-containing protein [Leptolyngbya sp. SIO1D8]
MKIFRKSLLNQLVGSFSLLSLVTVSLVSYSAYVQARSTLRDSVYERLKVAVSLKEYELNQWFKNQRQEAIVLARSPIVLNTVNTLVDTPANSDADTPSIATLQDYFDLVLEVKNDIQGIEILTTGGIVALSTNPEKVGVYMGLGNTTTYFEPNQSIVVPNIYFSSITGQPTITFATPIIDENGERQAVLAITLKLEAVNQIIREKTGLGETGETYLVREIANRNVFVSGEQSAVNQSDISLSSEGINLAIQGQDGQSLYRNYTNIPVVGVYRWLDNNNVALLAELHQKEAFKPAVNLGRRIFVIGLGTASILLVIVYLLARQIARPVLKVTDAAAAIETDQFETTMLDTVLNRSDELGQLARVFKKMVDQIYAREARLKRQVAELTIEIDQARKEQQVAEITETDYFLQLTQKAKTLRQNRKQ